jgi:methyltransferase (TIGR00027 family)
MAQDSSKMALGVLTMTSVGATDPDAAVRVEDPIGPRMLEWRDGKYSIGKTSFLHPLFRRGIEKSSPGSYGFLVGRLLYMDDVVRQEASAGMDQLVILGAGYDTRAYRMSELAGTRVFEVDLPAMSREKRRRLKKVIGELPDHVEYVEVDFNSEDFGARLADRGFDESGRTLFVLCGVSMYLPREALLELFSRVAAQSGAMSSLLFDYLFDDALAHPERYPGAERWAKDAVRAGEHLRFGVAMDQLEPLVESGGLRLARQSSMAEVADRYLRRSDGTLVAEPYDFTAIAHAVAAS